MMVTDSTLPFESTVARPRSCSGISLGTASVRMPSIRQTSLATIHVRPPLANTWTEQGLLPATRKVTAVVGCRPVSAMTDVAPLARRDGQYGWPEATGSRPPVPLGHGHTGQMPIDGNLPKCVRFEL